MAGSGEQLPVARRWLRRMQPGISLATGSVSLEPLRIATDDVRLLLRECAAPAAGVPAATARVVWATTRGELLVRLDGIDVVCGPGLVTVTVPVACDQVAAGAATWVVFGVGTPTSPAGLIMSTMDRPGGPDVVIDAWGEAVTAFAWECLLRVAVTACAAVGNDDAGASLVPALLAADRDELQVTPMSRHRVRAAGPVVAGPVVAGPVVAGPVAAPTPRRGWPS